MLKNREFAMEKHHHVLLLYNNQFYVIDILNSLNTHNNSGPCTKLCIKLMYERVALLLFD